MKHDFTFARYFNCQTEKKTERTTPCFPADIPEVGHAGLHDQYHPFDVPGRPGVEVGAGKLSMIKAWGVLHSPEAGM